MGGGDEEKGEGERERGEREGRRIEKGETEREREGGGGGDEEKGEGERERGERGVIQASNTLYMQVHTLLNALGKLHNQLPLFSKARVGVY